MMYTYITRTAGLNFKIATAIGIAIILLCIYRCHNLYNGHNKIICQYYIKKLLNVPYLGPALPRCKDSLYSSLVSKDSWSTLATFAEILKTIIVERGLDYQALYFIAEASTWTFLKLHRWILISQKQYCLHAGNLYTNITCWSPVGSEVEEYILNVPLETQSTTASNVHVNDYLHKSAVLHKCDSANNSYSVVSSVVYDSRK